MDRTLITINDHKITFHLLYSKQLNMIHIIGKTNNRLLEMA